MNETLKEYSLLFVEDEKAIRENYVNYLQRHFNNVYEAKDGEEAYKIYKDKKPRILIIDINIPKLTGIELVKKIRENDHSAKIIMLTAQSDLKTLLKAAELKLTKYLVKPVSRSELKDALGVVSDELSKFDILVKKVLKLNDTLHWNFDTSELFGDNVKIILTKKEIEVLELFFSNINKTYSYDEIILHVWPDSFEDKTDALKTIIKNLRKKLPKDIIKNVFGVGYKIDRREDR
ncbi:response regulator transcription factor [bacterium]|nr:response regulator transcription factor [bacterium]MBU1884592.1 response regulator transcription factor [bacterium]